MRINIFRAGLVTYLMAGKGFLPQDEPEPRYAAGKDSQNPSKPPVPPRQTRRDEQAH